VTELLSTMGENGKGCGTVGIGPSADGRFAGALC
jgi:hypothetical protein